MEQNKGGNSLLNLIVIGAVAYGVWYFYFRKTKKTNSQDAIDGKTTFYSADETKFVRGYEMPSDINLIKPDEKGEILITQKPDENVFGDLPSTGVKVTVDKENKTIVYKFSPTETWIETYTPEVVKKLVLIDKKYM
jgi:hypothetical protein